MPASGDLIVILLAIVAVYTVGGIAPAGDIIGRLFFGTGRKESNSEE